MHSLVLSMEGKLLRTCTIILGHEFLLLFIISTLNGANRIPGGL